MSHSITIISINIKLLYLLVLVFCICCNKIFILLNFFHVSLITIINILHMLNKYSSLYTSSLVFKVHISLIYAPLIMFTTSLVVQEQGLTFDWWLWLHILIIIHRMFTHLPTSKACHSMWVCLCSIMACIALSLNLSLKSLSEQKIHLPAEVMELIMLFEVLSEKFKPQHNETILSLQYCKVARKQNENTEVRNGLDV